MGARARASLPVEDAGRGYKVSRESQPADHSLSDHQRVHSSVYFTSPILFLEIPQSHHERQGLPSQVQEPGGQGVSRPHRQLQDPLSGMF